MNEAPASLNFFMEHEGRKLQITLRDEDEFDLWERYEGLVEYLEERTAGAITTAHRATTGEQAGVEGEQWFETSQLVGSLVEGKRYWKVKGQPRTQFNKYGVTVWPEVLAQMGFDSEAAEVKNYPLPGYRAYYTVNEKGNAQKVVRFDKIA